MSGVTLAFRGAVGGLDAETRRRLFDRVLPGGEAIRGTVADIVELVRASGDDALVELARRLDGATLATLEVPGSACREALARTPPTVRAALERAARNLETAHRAWMPEARSVEPEPGVRLVRRPDPVGRVGIYAPGGRAAYPSSVLMAAVPARVAGVTEVILCSPPNRAGRPHDLVLAAAELAGVDRVFALGGAGAIAAMALGTASVPRVDRIVGPGNAWVMEAKLQVAHLVGIDGPAGPSEVLILADRSAPTEAIARELVAQAEHDPRAASVAVVIGPAALADAIEAQLATLAAEAPRSAVVLESLAAAGGLLRAETLDEAIEFANRYAAEHLLVALDQAEAVAPRLRNAGAVFLGVTSSVPFGDYLTGANHVLPTGGLARAYSGLGPEDFVRWTSIQAVSPAAAAALAGDVATLAEAEGLPGHASAARYWETLR
jgi:histidinol dehydrogenase